MYADYRDIDAQINHILNRTPADQFTSVGDTSDSADHRYSDDAVTEARRKSAYKIFEAIGGNPSHPFWAQLMELVFVDHNDPIPVHYGEIGIPLVAPNSTELETHAAGVLTVHDLGHASGTLTIVDPAVAFASGYLTVTNPSTHATGSLTISQGAAATGSYTVAVLPQAGDTMTVYGVVFTFTNTAFPTETDMPIMGSLTTQASVIAARLNQYAMAHPTSNVALATYSALGSNVFIEYNEFSPDGNSFTTTATGSRVVANQATLAGGSVGVVSGETIFVNGVQCLWTTGSDTDTVVYLGEPELSAEDNVINMANALANSHVAPLVRATYTPNLNVLDISHNRVGRIGNLFGLEDSEFGAITASGETLTGGVGGVIEGDQMVLYGVTVTFSNSVFDEFHIQYSTEDDAQETANFIVEALNGVGSGNIATATYTQTYPPVPGEMVETMRAVRITFDTVGTAGNSYTLGTMPDGILKSGNNLVGGFTTGIVVGSTLNVNGVTYSFISGASSGTDIQIGGTLAITATNIAAALNLSVNTLISVATYAAVGAVVYIQYDATGVVGNSFLINDSGGTNAGAIMASAPHLLYGERNIEDDERLVVNGAEFTFSYTATGTYIILPADTPAGSAIAIADALNGSEDPLISLATYTAVDNTILVRYDVQGTIGNSFTLQESSGGNITVSDDTLLGGGVEIDEKYLAAVPADPDWIDDARNNLLGLSTDFFDTGRIAHDGDIGDGVSSPLAGRYDTSNGVFKFTGYKAKIPMITIPTEDGVPGITIISDAGESTEDSSTLVFAMSDPTHIGLLAILVDDDDFELARGTVVGVDAGVSIDISPYVANHTGTGTLTLYEIEATEAQEMADTRIPLTLSALNVKLALPMLAKEGDNMFRTAQWLGTEGERDLMLVRAGAVKVSPISLEKMTQVGQKYNS